MEQVQVLLTAVITHDFTGVTPVIIRLILQQMVRLDITAQTDTDSPTFQVNAVPAAPAGLSPKDYTTKR